MDSLLAGLLDGWLAGLLYGLTYWFCHREQSETKRGDLKSPETATPPPVAIAPLENENCKVQNVNLKTLLKSSIFNFQFDEVALSLSPEAGRRSDGEELILNPLILIP